MFFRITLLVGSSQRSAPARPRETTRGPNHCFGYPLTNLLVVLLLIGTLSTIKSTKEHKGADQKTKKTRNSGHNETRKTSNSGAAKNTVIESTAHNMHKCIEIITNLGHIRRIRAPKMPEENTQQIHESFSGKW